MHTPQYLPPPEFDHPLPNHLTMDQRVALWLDAVEASDEMLLARLRATCPDEESVRAAYRRWYEEYSREHYEMLVRMLERFNQALSNDGQLRSPENA